jgi:hypothetical protein
MSEPYTKTVAGDFQIPAETLTIAEPEEVAIDIGTREGKIAYLTDLHERLMRVPAAYGIDGYDIDMIATIVSQLQSES